MGDFDNDTQTSSDNDKIFTAINTLAGMIAWRCKNMGKVQIIAFKMSGRQNRVVMIYTVNIGTLMLHLMIPFGSELLKRKHKALQNADEAGKVRDEFIETQIANAREKIKNGEALGISSIFSIIFITFSFFQKIASLCTEAHDLTTLMLKDTDANGNAKFSVHEIRCNVYSFLFAGHETTSGAIQQLLFFLGEYPEWHKRIGDEFDSFGGKITSKTLKTAHVTEAVIKETLRISHVVGNNISRSLTVKLYY